MNIQNKASYTDYDFINKYLSKFSYEDFEGTLDYNDDETLPGLSLNDFVLIMFEEPSTGNQTFISARITLDDDYQIPCFVVNEDLDNFSDSGELMGIHEASLDGAVFINVSKEVWEENIKESSSF